MCALLTGFVCLSHCTVLIVDNVGWWWSSAVDRCYSVAWAVSTSDTYYLHAVADASVVYSIPLTTQTGQVWWHVCFSDVKLQMLWTFMVTNYLICCLHYVNQWNVFIWNQNTKKTSEKSKSSWVSRISPVNNTLCVFGDRRLWRWHQRADGVIQES